MLRLLIIFRRLGREGAVVNARDELMDTHLRAVAADALARRVQTGDDARATASKFVAPAVASAA